MVSEMTHKIISLNKSLIDGSKLKKIFNFEPSIRDLFDLSDILLVKRCRFTSCYLDHGLHNDCLVFHYKLQMESLKFQGSQNSLPYLQMQNVYTGLVEL